MGEGGVSWMLVWKLGEGGRAYWEAGEDVDRVGFLDVAFGDQGLRGGVGDLAVGGSQHGLEGVDDELGLLVRQAEAVADRVAWDGAEGVLELPVGNGTRDGGANGGQSGDSSGELHVERVDETSVSVKNDFGVSC